MRLNTPIIIFGTGRSGTTIFQQMLSRHPNLAWLSPTLHFFPKRLGLNKLFMYLMDSPPLENLLRKNIDASEGYPLWDVLVRGFNTPCRDLLASDVSIKAKKHISETLSKLTTNKRNRLLLKITGWSRTGYLNETFPDAKFIHIVRDGRAVANSLINTGFWLGWGGPEKWRWGPLPEAYYDEWLKYDRSFIVMAAIQWKILMDASEKAIKHLDQSKLLEIKYEDLCINPIQLFKKVRAMMDRGFSLPPSLQQNMYHLIDTNNKYRDELSLSQQTALNVVLSSHLQKYGYR